jgi:type IV pilus assembly protein PilA
MELLIVISIILVITLFAFPKIKAAVMHAHETSAIKTVQAIYGAEVLYASRYPALGYTCNLKALGPPATGQPPSQESADLLDGSVAGGNKDGYQFTLQGCMNAPNGTRVVSYQIVATPEVSGTTGIRAFCADTNGAVHEEASGNAAACLGRD